MISFSRSICHLIPIQNWDSGSKEVEGGCLFSRQTTVSATTGQFGKTVKEKETQRQGKLLARVE